MTVKDILNYTCGREPDGMPRANVGLTLSMVSGTPEDPDKQTLEERVSTSCEVQIYPSETLIGVDLKFESYLDVDLSDFWDIIEKYNAFIQSYDPDSNECPFLEVTIVPDELDGELYINAINPCFRVLTSDNPKNNHNTIISLAFNTDNNFFVLQPENFNASKYIADAEREAEAKIALMEQDEIRRMKEDNNDNFDEY